MEYLRVAPDLDSDPHLMAAGFWGAQVFQLLLRVSALKDLRGRIPAKFQSHAWLARFWNLTKEDLNGIEPEDVIARGVQRLLDVEQVRVEAGHWVLGGWEKMYTPKKTAAQRQHDYKVRTGQVACAGCEIHPVTPGDAGDAAASPRKRGDAGDNGDATHPPTPPTHPQKKEDLPVRPTHTPDQVPKGGTKAATERTFKVAEVNAALDFLEWMVKARAKALPNAPPEERPPGFESWYATASTTRTVNVERLKGAYRAYLLKPFWRDKGCPASAFFKQWSEYLPDLNAEPNTVRELRPGEDLYADEHGLPAKAGT